MAQKSRADAAGVRVVHQLPGRMRVRVDGARSEAEMLRKVEPLLARMPRTASIEVRPGSASVVIHYGGERTGPNAAAVQSKAGAYARSTALAPKLFAPIAASLVTRLVAPRGRGAALWLELTLLAFDALLHLEGARRSRPQPSTRVAPVRPANRRTP